MKNSNFILALIIICAAFAIPKLTNGTVWRVNNNASLIQNPSQTGNCTNCKQDLNSAVAAAASGDTIYLEGSATPYAGLSISKNVTIIGTGYFLSGAGSNSYLQFNTYPSVINSTITFASGSAGSVIEGIMYTALSEMLINTNNITVRRCYISVSTSGILHTTGTTNITIKQNYIVGQFGNNGSGATTQNVIITNNYFGQRVTLLTGSTGFVEHNVLAGGISNHANVQVSNNILASVLENSVNTTANIHHNVIYNTFPAWLTSAPGNTNTSLALANIFTTGSSTDGNWDVAASCNICLSTSSDGTNVGMYGGISPYIKSGIPNIPTIYQLDVQHTIIYQGQTDSTTVSTRSNNKN